VKWEQLQEKKEDDELKKYIFLLVAALLILGLVLPGCGGAGQQEEEEEEEEEGVIYTFENGEIVFGIAGEVGHATGDMAKLGATLGSLAINDAGGIDIDGVGHEIVLQVVDTQEATDETGESGTTAMEAAIDDVDFFMGGFRTEAVEEYRDVAMDGEKIFLNCGAATEALQHSCVTDYDKYKYWFKITPYNEYGLASSVLKLVGLTASEIREALGMAADANLDACIIAEDLEWSRDEQVPLLEAGLPPLHITNLETYLVSSLDSASTIGALADIAGNHDPHIIIPVYSGTMGVYYAATLLQYVGAGALAPMSVGINVYAQLKQPWAAGLADPSPGGGAYCAYNVHLDTWAEGVVQSSTTIPFLTAFMSYASGEYPLYTAQTYDACFILQACLEEVGYMEDGVGKAKADDIIAWFEEPGNAPPITTGGTGWYPPITGGGLTEAQVESLYDLASYGYTYNANDWKTPPCTTHDVVYGPEGAHGVGCQWQWDTATSQWTKFGIWPAEGTGVVDQYGDWDFEFPGTKDLILGPWVTAHFGGS
jgi:branched-chain amino acid transport system substrate-binding protein